MYSNKNSFTYVCMHVGKYEGNNKPKHTIFQLLIAHIYLFIQRAERGTVRTIQDNSSEKHPNIKKKVLKCQHSTGLYSKYSAQTIHTIIQWLLKGAIEENIFSCLTCPSLEDQGLNAILSYLWGRLQHVWPALYLNSKLNHNCLNNS